MKGARVKLGSALMSFFPVTERQRISAYVGRSERWSNTGIRWIVQYCTAAVELFGEPPASRGDGPVHAPRGPRVARSTLCRAGRVLRAAKEAQHILRLRDPATGLPPEGSVVDPA